MPNNFLNLQLFGDEGTAAEVEIATDTADAVSSEGVATEGIEPEAQATDGTVPEETWDDLIKGKYKKEYSSAVKAAVNKRFKNHQNLQAQIDSIDPIVKSLANKYGIQPNPDGSIPINVLQAKLDEDDSMYEQEAFERGMSVKDLRQIKQLERENQQLRQRTERTRQQEEWDAIVQQGESLKQTYPEFDLDTEMQNEQFGRLLATMQKSGFPNALQTAYEACHRDEIMGGAMRYAVAQTEKKISNSIQANAQRPIENGVSKSAPSSVGIVDPSKLTRAQIQEYAMRAAKGERITFV